MTQINFLISFLGQKYGWAQLIFWCGSHKVKSNSAGLIWSVGRDTRLSMSSMDWSSYFFPGFGWELFSALGKPTVSSPTVSGSQTHASNGGLSLCDVYITLKDLSFLPHHNCLQLEKFLCVQGFVWLGWAHLDNLQYPSPFKVYNLVHLSSPSCHIMHSQVPGIMRSSLRGQSVYPRYLVHFVTWVKKCNKLANITISIKNMTSGKISARGTGFHSLFRHYSQIFFWMMGVLLLFVPAQYLNFLQKDSK